MKIKNWKLEIDKRGFTLVEIMVVIAILAIIFVVVLLALDPTRSLKKARDAQRRSDLQQIRNALDTYYNDKNCYPQNLDQLASPTVYIKKIPVDPHCISKGDCYVYVINSEESCPQWAALFAHLELDGSIFNQSGEATCPIISACGFNGQSYNANLNFCIFLGELDCSVVGDSLSYPTGYGAPTPTPYPDCTAELKKYKCVGIPEECNDVSPEQGEYCGFNLDCRKDAGVYTPGCCDFAC